MPKERGQSCHFTAERQETKRTHISPGDPTPIGKFTLGDISLKAFAGQIVNIAFQYVSTTSAYATWEVKNLHIEATCAGQTPIENVEYEAPAYKEIRHGQLIIIRSGVEYTVTGQRAR